MVRCLISVTNTTQLLTLSDSIVISVFAIVILSILGALFAKDHHSVMGSEDDPPNGTVVATAVFGAVGIYGVSLPPRKSHHHCMWEKALTHPNRFSSCSAAARHFYIREKGGGAPSPCRRPT